MASRSNGRLADKAENGWPASKVEMWPLARLKPYERNPRTHSDDQIALLARSMADDGVTAPILVDENGVIIAGHGRLLAAQRNGYDHYPVVIARGWSEEQKRAVRIKDNQIALLAGWDAELIKLEVGELKLAGFDLPLLGFDESALAAFLDTTAGQSDPDEAPPVPVNPVTLLGDLWVLGRHRLVCGDATSADDVARVLGGSVPHLMVTDPPYGVEYDPEWRDEAAKTCAAMGNRKDTAKGQVANDDRADWRAAWALFPGDVVYAWSPPGDLLVEHHNALIAAGFEIRMQIIWAKQQFAIGRGNYHVQHEPCWYAVRAGRTAHWQGDRTQSTLWEIDKSQKSETGHSTQKPVECMKRPIENNSAAGDAVYDPFVGSGTTVIAAEMTGRKCFAIEIDPGYCDVAVLRWQEFAGKAATLDGRTFEQVKAARLGTKRNRREAQNEKRGRKMPLIARE